MTAFVGELRAEGNFHGSCLFSQWTCTAWYIQHQQVYIPWLGWIIVTYYFFSQSVILFLGWTILDFLVVNGFKRLFAELFSIFFLDAGCEIVVWSNRFFDLLRHPVLCHFSTAMAFTVLLKNEARWLMGAINIILDGKQWGVFAAS